MGRVHVGDIFMRIAQELRVNNDAPPSYSVDEFLNSVSFKLRLSVTDDLESTELDYLERYGEGRNFHFRLLNYEHGKILAGGIYRTLLGTAPDMRRHTGGQFAADAKLYLFIHISNVEPKLVAQAAEESELGE
jgi:hypothetical protein